MIKYGLLHLRRYERINMAYLLYLPEDMLRDEHLPLIVFLHGGGERGDDPRKLTCHSLPQKCMEGLNERCMVFAPQCPNGQDWLVLLKETKEAVDTIARRYKADKTRISLTGISMGAYGAWELAMMHPNYFSALAPICGGGMAWQAEKLVNMPVWAFHGSNDEVVSCNNSREMTEAIIKAGGDPRLTVYEGVGHHSWEKAYDERELLKWLIQPDKR